MQLEIGKIYEGKICEITKFGAFVEVGEKTGMVHISEVSNTFVNDINEHLKIGQEVKVKVLNLTDDGKISLSIKKALPQQERPKRNFNNQNRGDKNSDGKFNRGDNRNRGFNSDNRGNKNGSRGFDKNKNSSAKNSPPRDFDDIPNRYGVVNGPSKDASFEEMLSKFKLASEEKFSDMKNLQDVKRTRPRRK